MPAPIWLVTGVPGVGKGAVADELCRRYPRALHLPCDDLRDFVRSGRTSPLEPWTDETRLQFSLSWRASARIAALYADHGFAVVIDDVVCESDLRYHVEVLGGRPLRKVYLTAPLDVLIRRNARRTNKAFDPRILEPKIRELHELWLPENTAAAGWQVIDTSALTAPQVVDVLVAG